ncbi:MAG: hypothetical protein EU533_08655, partial [Promethearchaeota archaeon]
MKKTILISIFSIFLLMILPAFNSTVIINVEDSEVQINSSLSTSGTEKIYWQDNGTVIVNKEDNYEWGYKLCSDGKGGAIIAWYDDREILPNTNIYAQRIDSNGIKLWGKNGMVICNNTGRQGDPNLPTEELDICSDGNGGAIIVWRDQRRDEGVFDGDIYAQRVDLNGNTLWTDNGTVICNSTGEQRYPKLCSDGNNGAIITWQHTRTTGDEDIHAQYINSTGVKQWGAINDYNGTVICNINTGDQEFPRICSDGKKGAIITWRDKRNTESYFNIYAQRINWTGLTDWIDNGTVICNEKNDQGGGATGSNPPEFSICSDENGGAVITWRDEREGTADNYASIYTQKINSTGNTKWAKNGTVICNITQSEQRFPQICSDNNGGAIITWESLGEMDYEIYAQRINSNGDSQWIKNGTIICNEKSGQRYPQICIDGKGGAIITWDDFRNAPTSYDIYAQLINSNGQTQWNRNGTLLCNYGTLEQTAPQICTDLNGGAIIIWRDNREDASGDVYAQRIGTPITKSGTSESSDDDDDDEVVR